MKKMEQRENNASFFSSGFNKFKSEKKSREHYLTEEQKNRSKKKESMQCKTKIRDDIIQDIHFIVEKNQKKKKKKEEVVVGVVPVAHEEGGKKKELILNEKIEEYEQNHVKETKETIKIDKTIQKKVGRGMDSKKGIENNSNEELNQGRPNEINEIFQDSLQLKLEKLNNKFSYKYLLKNNESLSIYLNEYNAILNHCNDEIKQEMYIHTTVLKNDITKLFEKAQIQMKELHQVTWSEKETIVKEPGDIEHNEIKEEQLEITKDNIVTISMKENSNREKTKDSAKENYTKKNEVETKIKKEKINCSKDHQLNDFIDFLIKIINEILYKIIINSTEKKEMDLSRNNIINKEVMQNVEKQIKEKKSVWEEKWKKIQIMYEQMEKCLQNCILIFEKKLSVCMNKLDNEVKMLENKIKTKICIPEQEATDIIKKETKKYKEYFIEFLNYFDDYIMNIYNSLHKNYKKYTVIYYDTFQKCSKEQCNYVSFKLQNVFTNTIRENSNLQTLIQRLKENYEKINEERNYFKEDPFLSKFWKSKKPIDPFSYLSLHHLRYIIRFKEIENTVKEFKQSILYVLFSQPHVLYYISKNSEKTKEEKLIEKNDNKQNTCPQEYSGKTTEITNVEKEENVNKGDQTTLNKEIHLKEENAKNKIKKKKKEENEEEEGKKKEENIKQNKEQKIIQKEEDIVNINTTNSSKDNLKLFNEYIENILNYYNIINLRDDCFLLTFFEFMSTIKENLTECIYTMEHKIKQNFSFCKLEFKSLFEQIPLSLKEYSQNVSTCLVCTNYEQLQMLLVNLEEQQSNIQSQIESIRNTIETKTTCLRKEMKQLLSNFTQNILRNIGIHNEENKREEKEKERETETSKKKEKGKEKEKEKEKKEIEKKGKIRSLDMFIEDESFSFESSAIFRTVYKKYQYNMKYILYCSSVDHNERKGSLNDTNNYMKWTKEKQEKEGWEKIKKFLSSEGHCKIPFDVFPHVAFLFSKNIQEIRRMLEKKVNFKTCNEQECDDTQKNQIHRKENAEREEQEIQKESIYFDKSINYDELFFNQNIIKEHFRELLTTYIDFLKKYFLETIHNLHKRIENDNYFGFAENIIQMKYNKYVTQHHKKIEEKKEILEKECNEVNQKYENIVEPVKEILEEYDKTLIENQSHKMIQQEIKKIDKIFSDKVDPSNEFKNNFERCLQDLQEIYRKEEKIWNDKIDNLRKEIKKTKVNMQIQLDITEGSWTCVRLRKDENMWMEILKRLEKKKNDLQEKVNLHMKQYKEKYKEIIMLSEKNKVKHSKNTTNKDKGKELSLNEEVKNEVTLFYVLIYYIKEKIQEQENVKQIKKKKKGETNREKKAMTNSNSNIKNPKDHSSNKNEILSNDLNIDTHQNKIEEEARSSNEQNVGKRNYIDAEDKYKEVKNYIYELPTFLKISEICSLHIKKNPPLFESFFIYQKIKNEIPHLLFEKTKTTTHIDAIHFDVQENEKENTQIELNQGKQKEKKVKTSEEIIEKNCFIENVVVRKYCDLKFVLYISVYVIYNVCKIIKLSDPTRQWVTSSKSNYIHPLFLSYDLSHEIYKDVILNTKKQNSKQMVKELKFGKTLPSSFIYSTAQQVYTVDLIHLFLFEKKLAEQVLTPYFSHLNHFSNDDINKNYKRLQTKYAKDVIELSTYWKILAKKLMYHIFGIIYKNHKELVKERSNFLQMNFKKAFHKISNELSLKNEDIMEIRKRKKEMKKLTIQYMICIQNFLSNHLYSFFENLYNNFVFAIHLMNFLPSIEMDSLINQSYTGENDAKGNNIKLKNELKNNFVKIEYTDHSEQYDLSDLKRKIKKVYSTFDEGKKGIKGNDNLLNLNIKESKRNSEGIKTEFPKEPLFLEYMESNTPIVKKLENKIEKYLSKMYSDITKNLDIKKKEVILMISEDKRVNRKYYEYENSK